MHKLTIAALIVVSIAAAHCKKSSSSTGGGGNGSYYMKFNLNGTPVDYTSEAAANLTPINSDGLYSAVLVAYQNFTTASSKNTLLITVLSTNPIAANTPYNDPAKSTEPNGSQVPTATVFWEDSAGVGYLTVGSLSDASGYIPIGGMVTNAKVTITELTSTDLKGTFSGTVYNSGNFSDSAQITNGEFYLKRQ